MTLNDLCALADRAERLLGECYLGSDDRAAFDLRWRPIAPECERWTATARGRTGIGVTAEDAVRALLSLLHAALAERLGKIEAARDATLEMMAAVNAA